MWLFLFVYLQRPESLDWHHQDEATARQQEMLACIKRAWEYIPGLKLGAKQRFEIEFASGIKPHQLAELEKYTLVLRKCMMVSNP